MPPLTIASDSESESVENIVARNRPQSKPARGGKINSSSTCSSTVGNNQPENGSAQALQIAQEQNFALRQQLKKMTLAANSREVEASKSKSRLPSNEPDGDPEPAGTIAGKFDADVAKFGRKYSIMICPWIDVGVFDDLKGRPNVNPNCEARYANKASMREGTIAELYDFVPEEFHKLMEKYARFASEFRHHLQSARSNAVSSVRQRAGHLYNMKPEYFDVSFDRASVSELQALLKLPSKSLKPGQENPYALLAPILFPGSKYDRTLRTLFRNPLLPQMARIMLYGKSPATKSKPQTLGEIWKVDCATPGLIAFTAVLARFLVSPDEEFRSIGKVTKINWMEDFNMYKCMLSATSKRVREVFAFFDEIVFGQVALIPAIGPSASEVKEEFDDAMRVFGADDSFDEESDGDAQRDDDAETISTGGSQDLDLVNDVTISLEDEEPILLDEDDTPSLVPVTKKSKTRKSQITSGATSGEDTGMAVDSDDDGPGREDFRTDSTNKSPQDAPMNEDYDSEDSNRFGGHSQYRGPESLVDYIPLEAYGSDVEQPTVKSKTKTSSSKSAQSNGQKQKTSAAAVAITADSDGDYFTADVEMRVETAIPEPRKRKAPSVTASKPSSRVGNAAESSAPGLGTSSTNEEFQILSDGGSVASKGKKKKNAGAAAVATSTRKSARTTKMAQPSK